MFCFNEITFYFAATQGMTEMFTVCLKMKAPHFGINVEVTATRVEEEQQKQQQQQYSPVGVDWVCRGGLARLKVDPLEPELAAVATVDPASPWPTARPLPASEWPRL